MSPAEGRPLLEVSGLNAFYGKSQVVFDLHLKIGRGEVVTLLGRNGAGKTSTLLGIAGVIASRAAALTVDGRDLIASAVFQTRARRGLDGPVRIARLSRT